MSTKYTLAVKLVVIFLDISHHVIFQNHKLPYSASSVILLHTAVLLKLNITFTALPSESTSPCLTALEPKL